MLRLIAELYENKNIYNKLPLISKIRKQVVKYEKEPISKYFVDILSDRVTLEYHNSSASCTCVFMLHRLTPYIRISRIKKML